MTSLLKVDKVKYQCSCGTFKPLCYLYFCRHCLKVKCKECVILEVDCRFCPSCYENLQPHEAINRKNRCQQCFNCPCCGHTLVTRATNTASLSANTSATVTDLDESSLSSTSVMSGQATPSKKVYYLACGFCRWSTRDINLNDQLTINSWKQQDNIHEQRFQELLLYYKQIANKEKLEKDRKKYTTSKGGLLLRTSSKTDKYGLLTPLTRRSIGLRTTTPTSSTTSLRATNTAKPVDSSTIQPKQSTALETITPLEDTFFNLDLSKMTTMKQRLSSVEIQPVYTDGLYPISKHFTSKQSKRCKECDHNVLKPEPSPKVIKFKLHQMAMFFIPDIRIWYHPTWDSNRENVCVLSIVNQSDEQITLKLMTIDDILKNGSSTGIDEIKVDEKLLTAKLDFSGGNDTNKEKIVQLHAHIDMNETDSKYDNEFRENDDKQFVIWRKFAKIAIKCTVKPHNENVKNIIAGFVMEHRVVGISSVQTSIQPAQPEQNSKIIRHLVTIDFGSIDEPALTLHSSLKEGL
ncbi:unnamed protein product [Didymodactylos carnosus]|uniref:Dynactin subunit 4 n=1 Tax=Didymodactylos carnosus TaxID=1234261 RepID=A0A815U8U4_9BILA|nr:unnamed protein product [Didymodactylos carnosus]CAF1517504.1 unnamed protein product [Didymodactylos carnosus]CAF4163300.1 unnamed protein product [Didymodactylos carnosus]CAF4377316.1 unnamed protein product [Didymodactylos carnosus]